MNLNDINYKVFPGGEIQVELGDKTDNFIYASITSSEELMKLLLVTDAIKDGKEVFLFKDPITDDGTKKSQKGKVVVFKNMLGNIEFVDEQNQESIEAYKESNLLRPLFENGKLLRETSLLEIKEKLNSSNKIKELV